MTKDIVQVVITVDDTGDFRVLGMTPEQTIYESYEDKTTVEATIDKLLRKLKPVPHV